MSLIPRSAASALSQRETYKLIDKILAGKIQSNEELLRTLVRDVCEREEFHISGGRVWQLNDNNDSYSLLFQHGDVEAIPDGYTISIAEQPVFAALAERKSITNQETDTLLLEKGIRLYSATGVGELRRRNMLRYYEYVLAFNAPEMGQEFYQTISIIGSAATTALRNLRLGRQQAKIKKDLDQASEIQRSLLPDHELEFNDFSVFGISVPDSVVGGDYFDYLKPTDQEDEDRAGIVISDAASKGLPAAVQALFVSGAIRMGISYHTKISALISRLNTLIYETFPFERFVTLFYCELTSSKNGLVLFVNAGHCSPIHYSAATGILTELPTTGSILGISPHQKFSVESINMKPGDVLLLFTDGVMEARNESDELYGYDRLKSFLTNHHTETARNMAYNLLEEVQQFSVNASYTDDKTLIVIKRESSKD